MKWPAVSSQPAWGCMGCRREGSGPSNARGRPVAPHQKPASLVGIGGGRSGLRLQRELCSLPAVCRGSEHPASLGCHSPVLVVGSQPGHRPALRGCGPGWAVRGGCGSEEPLQLLATVTPLSSERGTPGNWDLPKEDMTPTPDSRKAQLLPPPPPGGLAIWDSQPAPLSHLCLIVVEGRAKGV